MSERGNVDARIARVEVGQDALREDLDRLVGTVERLASEVSKGFRAANKTNWGTLAAWAGVILTLVGLGGAGFVRELGRVDDQVDILTEARVESAYARGKMDQMVTGNQGNIVQLDVVLQREMRLLRDQQSAEQSGVSARLKTEMELLNDATERRLDDIWRLIEPDISSPGQASATEIRHLEQTAEAMHDSLEAMRIGISKLGERVGALERVPVSGSN